MNREGRIANKIAKNVLSAKWVSRGFEKDYWHLFGIGVDAVPSEHPSFVDKVDVKEYLKAAKDFKEIARDPNAQGYPEELEKQIKENAIEAARRFEMHAKFHQEFEEINKSVKMPPNKPKDIRASTPYLEVTGPLSVHVKALLKMPRETRHEDEYEGDYWDELRAKANNWEEAFMDVVFDLEKKAKKMGLKVESWDIGA